MLYFVAALCVLGMVVGQILFKLSALGFVTSGTYFSARPAAILASALILYGITSVAWVWVLQRIDLGRIYPFMAMAFVFVPVGSYIVFGEEFKPQYFLGIFMIMIGIVIVVKS